MLVWELARGTGSAPSVPFHFSFSAGVLTPSACCSQSLGTVMCCAASLHSVLLPLVYMYNNAKVSQALRELPFVASCLRRCGRSRLTVVTDSHLVHATAATAGAGTSAVDEQAVLAQPQQHSTGAARIELAASPSQRSQRSQRSRPSRPSQHSQHSQHSHHSHHSQHSQNRPSQRSKSSHHNRHGVPVGSSIPAVQKTPPMAGVRQQIGRAHV